MACGTFTQKGVPADQLQNAVLLWKASKPPPTSVTSKQDPDGTYTITAVFPDCPPGTSHDPGGSGPQTG